MGTDLELSSHKKKLGGVISHFGNKYDLSATEVLIIRTLVCLSAIFGWGFVTVTVYTLVWALKDD
ncbi:MAG: hypothetical protein VW683_11570 [Betaproteobacteria bacterium]